MFLKSLSAAALAALMIATPAAAANATDANAGKEIVRDIVKYDDLDLTRDADVARLKLRIAYKAKSLCATGFDRDKFSVETRACRAEVIASAGWQVARAVQIAALRQKSRKG